MIQTVMELYFLPELIHHPKLLHLALEDLLDCYNKACLSVSRQEYFSKFALAKYLADLKSIE